LRIRTRVQRRISGAKREEVAAGLRKLHNKEFYYLNYGEKMKNEMKGACNMQGR
jgi:hypothetical protein